jgi:hypothetical protein
MIVAGAASGTLPSNAMSPAAVASIAAGSAIFLALIALVAHASYKRKKEQDWHIAEWHRAESEARTQREWPDKEMLH